MTLDWKDLPKWQKDNEYIRSGYRRPSYSTYGSMREITKLHNETVNIWSHLLAAILFSIYLIQFLSESDGLSMDILIVVISFLGIITCFTLSTIYHLFSNHSRTVTNWTQRLDHLGVVIVIWTSAISFTYFGLYCHHQLRGLYMGFITAAALISTIYVFRPGFRDPNSRLIRTFTYFTLGFSAFLPAIHLLTQADELALYQHTILISFKNLAMLNSVGGLFYAIRIPERFHREIFDIYCASHQIMHVMVACGALVYQTGLLTTREYWRSDIIRGTVCLAAY
jgi:adiponectin receptor